MKIETHAKPIRIRIKSGGEEHSSLDTLCKNLNVEDIFPLVKDKRLSRWLKQKGEIAMAEKVDNLKISSSNNEPDDRIYFDILSVFLNDEIKLFKVIDIYKLYSSWHDSTLSKSNNYRFLQQYLLKREKGIKFLYSLHRADFTDQEWSNKLTPFKDANDPQIEKIKNEINAKLQQQAKKERSVYSEDIDPNMLAAINEWKQNIGQYKPFIWRSDEEKLNSLKYFLKDLTKSYNVYCNSKQQPYFEVFQQFNQIIQKTDPFYKEKIFLRFFSLYKFSGNIEYSVFEELNANYNYPLAKLMLDSNRGNYKIDGECFVSANFQRQLILIVEQMLGTYRNVSNQPTGLEQKEVNKQNNNQTTSDKMKEEIAKWKRDPAEYVVELDLNEGKKLTDLKKFLRVISENLFKRYGTAIFYKSLDSLPDSTFEGYHYIAESALFYKEKKFLWAFTGYCYNYNVADRRNKEQVFEKLARDYKYPLAELMLKSYPEEYQIDGVNFTKENASTQLKFIVGHLLKY